MGIGAFGLFALGGRRLHARHHFCGGGPDCAQLLHLGQHYAFQQGHGLGRARKLHLFEGRRKIKGSSREMEILMYFPKKLFGKSSLEQN